MKDLRKIKTSGGNELVRGNNKKFLIYDNFFKNKYPSSDLQLVVTFYDIQNTASLVGITDINDVSEWNSFFNYGDYGGIVNKDWSPIEFESCTVDGNNLTLVPPNKDYSVIYAIEMYEYDSLGEHLIEEITLNGLPLFYIYVEDETLARNINPDLGDRIGKYDNYNDDFFQFILESYGFSGITFNTNDLNNLTRLGIRDAQNLTTINFNNLPYATTLNVYEAPLLENLTFNNLPSLNSLQLGNLNLTELNLINIETLTDLYLSDFNNLQSLNLSGLNSLFQLSLNYISSLESLTLDTPNLSNLNVYDVGLLDFNDYVLSALTTIYWQSTPLENFNNNELNALESLRLENNNLSGFTGNILPNMTYLGLSTNQLIGFDNNSFENLNQLYIDGNQNLSTFTNNDLPNLTILVSQYCNISDFSENTFPSLNTLYIGNNLLTTIDLSGLTNLTTLDMNTNSLTNLSIDGLINLNTINLANNNLNQSSVNHILAKLVEYGTTNGSVNITGVGNASPSGQGLTDKNTLFSRGWSVNVNG